MQNARAGSYFGDRLDLANWLVDCSEESISGIDSLQAVFELSLRYRLAG